MCYVIRRNSIAAPILWDIYFLPFPPPIPRAEAPEDDIVAEEEEFEDDIELIEEGQLMDDETPPPVPALDPGPTPLPLFSQLNPLGSLLVAGVVL
jgi:hypothetical protein